MPTFTQAILLGAERLTVAPAVPHPALEESWSQLDWSGPKETALLQASALLGGARCAGALSAGPLPAPEVAPADARPFAPPRTVAVLRQLLTEECRPLLAEWLERCAQADWRVPPFFLPTLLESITAAGERALLRRGLGARGRWLAGQNPDWAWAAGEPARPDASGWETGLEEERLALLRRLRAAEPARAVALLAQTWAEETPEFRAQALPLLAPALSLADEPLLVRALGDRRKEIRSAAQALLAALPESALARRLRATAETLLTFQRGFLSKKLEVALPAAFDPAWKADAIEEKPPAGLGEKAFWVQQIVALVSVAHWSGKFGLDPAALVALAAKSDEWGDLLLGAWFRAACLHREAATAAALIPVLLPRPKALPPGTAPSTAAAALLAVCTEAERWRLAASEPTLAWTALPVLGGAPGLAEGRALFEQLWRPIRDGTNPGGSPTAVLAARRLPPELRDEAARRFERDNGLSKPADAFLRALELRAELRAAFLSSTAALP